MKAISGGEIQETAEIDSGPRTYWLAQSGKMASKAADDDSDFSRHRQAKRL
jgi:hypothetical protein